jgi:hypothetical protein
MLIGDGFDAICKCFANKTRFLIEMGHFAYMDISLPSTRNL